MLETDYDSDHRSLYQLNTDLGLFSYQPQFDLQGTIIGLAAQASIPRPHAKLDNTGYAYVNRSFGVGASVGLMDQAFSNTTQSYYYTELGLLSQTSCIYNDTADLEVGPNLLTQCDLTQDDLLLLQLFDVQGHLPVAGESMPVETTAFGLESAQTVSLFAVTNGLNNTLGIIAGNRTGEMQYYGSLNNVQCDIKFYPANFTVIVNTTLQLITVYPLDDDLDMPPYGQLVINRTLDAMSTMSMVLTTANVSMLGQALMNNIDNVSPDGFPNSTVSNLLGITAAVDSFIDNILLSYALADLMITNDSVPSNVTSEEAAIVFGTPVYIYLIFITNLIIFLVYLAEALRTRGWRDLTTFNYMDAKTVIVGTSMGGTGIADKVNTLHEQNGSTWRAERRDRIAGQIHAQLMKSSQDVAAVVVSNVNVGTPSRRRRSMLDKPNGSATDILLQDMSGVSTLPQRLSHEERRSSLGSENVESLSIHEDLSRG